MKPNVGKYKVLFDRARGYVQLINSAILVYLLLNETGLHWYYFLVVPLLAFLVYYDNKKIIGQERDYVWSRSGRLKDMVDNIEIIKNHVEKIKN